MKTRCSASSGADSNNQSDGDDKNNNASRDDDRDTHVVIPDAPPRPVAQEDKRLFRDLRARESRIRVVKLQRSRVQVGDFVSNEVTAHRAARHKLQRRVVDMRRSMEEALAREAYDEAAALRDEISAAEKEVEDITDAIAAEVERATARYDAEL